MPGLFGILDLELGSPESRSEMAIIFEGMVNPLRHHAEDRLERGGSAESGLLVGRIGLAHLNPVPWPVEDDAQIPRSFVAGPLISGGADDPLATTTPRSWRGFFSAVLTDPRRQVTAIVADRRASVPVFHAMVGRWLLFAPEVKALLAAPSLGREPDEAALACLLAQGHLLGDQTLFRSVRRLRGGQLLLCEGRRVVVETYWRFAPGSAPDGTAPAELERELGRLVGDAAARNLGDPTRTVLFLSGGVDSRGILGGALAAAGGRGAALHTASWGAADGPAASDVAVAAAIARSVGTTHRFIRRQVEHYGENFRRVNRMVDALSDIAAFHPHEHQIMVDLRAAGFERVLRGDEVFGWSYPATTLPGALALVNLRRLRDVQDAGSVIRPEHWATLADASDGAIDAALDEVRSLDPNRAKDFLYFAHRLQCYLGTAGYYKQVELDQRNVLLDEPILDFLARVPERLRIDKKLYRDAMARTYPDLARLPLAQRDNLEDWTALLATGTPVRAYSLEELSDRSSGIWEYLDPAALWGLVEALGRPSDGSPVPRSRPRIPFRPLVRRALETVAPEVVFRIQARRSARSTIRLGPTNLVLRALVLKDWHDTFVAAR